MRYLLALLLTACAAPPGPGVPYRSYMSAEVPPNPWQTVSARTGVWECRTMASAWFDRCVAVVRNGQIYRCVRWDKPSRDCVLGDGIGSFNPVGE